MEHTNRLIKETSPYLLQHAHNPVDWYAWSDEALQKAVELDKPILVSIGYAACHWCHVMERESFENEETAALMNKYFICIKIDREERPDLDHFFMDALQAISGQGGWPLNMFLTSDGKPFYGGTYFPPRQVHNRISWMDMLEKIHEAYRSRRDEIEQQADNLIAHLQSANPTPIKPSTELSGLTNANFSVHDTKKMFEQLLTSADRTEGGFGRAPKFPQTFSIQYLLRYFYYHGEQTALDHASLSLKKMIRGGIYDQVGGGFCRYSTDTEWLAPHFEKMTYDNALLLLVMAEAYQLTADEELKIAAKETVDFMKREMLSSEGGFYAALDADSEGEEGKFYTWTKREFQEVLGDDSNILADFFDVTDEGNWEGINILRTKKSLAEWSVQHGISPERGNEIVLLAKQALLTRRSTRIRPSTDDKILLGWNALFNAALSRSAIVFNEPSWLGIASSNMDFLLREFYDSKAKHWLHTHKLGESKYSAFLDDLAYLVQSLIYLYEPTGDLRYLQKARDIMEYAIQHYGDESGVLFYFTPDFQHDILVRKKEIYDGATPSSNAVMAWNLYRLGILFDQFQWKERSIAMLTSVKEAAIKYPGSFGIWSNLFMEINRGTHEIAIVGLEYQQAVRNLLQRYLPNKVIMASEGPSDQFPLLKDRVAPKGEIRYHACRDYSCRVPVSTENELFTQILTNL
ncbi:MAG: thioredoxin domain-containing protein [bacterium]